MDSAQRRLERVSGHLNKAPSQSSVAPPASLRESLFDEIAYREKLFSILSSERYDYQFEQSTRELRESTFLKCKDLLQHKVISVDDVVNNPSKAMAFMETVWVREPKKKFGDEKKLLFFAFSLSLFFFCFFRVGPGGFSPLCFLTALSLFFYVDNFLLFRVWMNAATGLSDRSGGPPRRVVLVLSKSLAVCSYFGLQHTPISF
jgi:hypothetical protein